MFESLDKTLERLLIEELPIKKGEVDIRFNQPNREWSARVNRPTLNLYLHDVRENQKLRQTRPIWSNIRNDDGTVTQKRRPLRVDVHYILTAWAQEPEDEHRLLARAMMALFRHQDIPEAYLQEEMAEQPLPIPILAAQPDEVRNPSDLWQVLDNEMRPAIPCVLTISLDPYQPMTSSIVRTRELRMGPSKTQGSLLPLDPELVESFWTIGGTINRNQPIDPERVRLQIKESGQAAFLQADGQFSFGRLRAGNYTLLVTIDGGKTTEHPIEVPAPDYDLEVRMR
jgi:hypothetical protein